MLEKFIGIVKQQLQYWQYQVATFGPEHPNYRPAKIAKYQYLITDFTELLQYLEGQVAREFVDNSPTTPPMERGFQGSIFRPKRRLAEALAAIPEPPEATSVPDDLADLPPELLQELSESAKGETDPLIKIINDRGGTATLDEILIDLWRKYKEIAKRNMISNKLYRLGKRGLCWALPGKKGIYTTTKPTSAAAAPTDDEQGSPGTPEEPPASPASNSAQAATTTSPPTVSGLRRRKLGGELFASTATIPPSNPLKLKF